MCSAAGEEVPWAAETHAQPSNERRPAWGEGKREGLSGQAVWTIPKLVGCAAAVKIIVFTPSPLLQLVSALKSVMLDHVDVGSGLPLLETISMKVQQTGMELLR